jgi:hypothetical protein
MNKEIKEKWITALRSGEYKQCRNKLIKVKNDQRSFCCLGVLTDLAIKEGVISDNWKLNTDPKTISYGEYVIGHEENSVLIKEVMEWAELSDNEGLYYGTYDDNGVYKTPQSLAVKNDTGASFKQIANIIEKEF